MWVEGLASGVGLGQGAGFGLSLVPQTSINNSVAVMTARVSHQTKAIKPKP